MWRKGFNTRRPWTGYEVGYVAWGVGILVGMGAKLLGGEGVPTGIACAVLALLSIFSGKMVAAHYIVRGEIVDSMQDMFTQQDYDVAMREAEDFALLESEAEYPAFMVANDYSEADDPADVTDEELAYFVKGPVVTLRKNYDNQPSYEVWRRESEENAKELVGEFLKELPLEEAVVEDLGPIDILFALLGLGTAYKLGSGGAAEA